jgi:CheY-like chemotaxis protein
MSLRPLVGNAADVARLLAHKSRSSSRATVKPAGDRSSTERDAHREPAARAEPSPGKIMARATHILMVDDDDDFREALRGFLEGEGYTVYEAADGMRALRILLEVVPHFILFDLQMPVMNGWELYAALQKDAALAAIPIGVLSSRAHHRPFGSMHVLSKPVDLPKLMGLLGAIDAPEPR